MIGQDWVTCSPLLLRGKGKILGLHLPPESQGWGPSWGGGSHFPRSGIQFPGARSGAAGKMQMPDVHAQTKSKVGSGRAGWTRWLGPARGMHGDPAPFCRMSKETGCRGTPCAVPVRLSWCLGPPFPAARAHVANICPAGCWGSPSWSFLLLTGTVRLLLPAAHIWEHSGLSLAEPVG